MPSLFPPFLPYAVALAVDPTQDAKMKMGVSPEFAHRMRSGV